jgi:hypothetical protein
VAARVDADLTAAFVRDFEAGMDRFWAERNVETTELLRDMARFFAKFEPLPGNLYGELMKVFRVTRKLPVMVTTNYDLLIEQAVTQEGLLITYGKPPVGARNVPVLKIHGSCNFLPDLEPRQISGIAFDMSSSPSSSIVETGVRAATSGQEIIDFCNREDSIAPALAMYSPAKRPLFCGNFIRHQQQAWLSSLGATSRIYIIGLRIHLVDKHIWDPLAKSKAPLHYVGKEPDEFIDWAHASRRKRAFVLAESFEDAIPKIAMHHGYRATP